MESIAAIAVATVIGGRGHEAAIPRTVVAVILGGGAGTRLFPLTKRRAKPTVLIGDAYRLIDVPMRNCINIGINKVYVLTQFNSASLNRHLSRAYNFSNGVGFGDGFDEVLAATQRPGLEGKMWFQGTADAVRKFAWLFDDAKSKDIEDVLILSGDHLYRMDYMDFVQVIYRIKTVFHTSLSIDICCLPIDDFMSCGLEMNNFVFNVSRASDFGLMKIDDTRRVISFSEKPRGADLKAMVIDTTLLGLTKEEAEKKPYIASMGWRFPTANDFGSEIIPAATREINVKLQNVYWTMLICSMHFFQRNNTRGSKETIFSRTRASSSSITFWRVVPPRLVRSALQREHHEYFTRCQPRYPIVALQHRTTKGGVSVDTSFYHTRLQHLEQFPRGRYTRRRCSACSSLFFENTRISSIYTTTNFSSVRTSDGDTDDFPIRIGLHQGWSSIVSDGLDIFNGGHRKRRCIADG
ncbi:hypothetical protein ZWY2020_010397 [Hordeum vulgare]|nr:hypothetical protein ZWY2020_010397 [Hordeum vulgare]